MSYVRPLIVGFLLVGLVCNAASVGILSATKKIKQNKYKRLVLLLSLSDVTFIIELLALMLVHYIDDGAGGNATTNYLCVVMRYMLCGTMLFALFQTLLICIERLNATFVHKLKCLADMTSWWSVVVGFVACHLLFIGIPIAFSLSIRAETCSSLATENVVFIITANIPSVLMSLIVLSIYVSILVRMVKIERKKTNIGTTTSSNPASRGKANRNLKNILIFGVIVAFRTISTIPQSIVAFIAVFTGHTEDTLSLISSLNNILLLNPLIDPIFYCFAVKEYKDRLQMIFRMVFCKKPNAVADIPQSSVT